MAAPTGSKKIIIYSMIGVTKAHDKKVVLKDILLSYFYGANIGVLGLNGWGKSCQVSGCGSAGGVGMSGSRSSANSGR